MKALINTGVKMFKGLFNKNKMDINLDKTVETASDVIKSSSNKEQATVRHQNDMMSDSWLSKNIRPIIVAWSLAMLAFILIGSVFKLEFDSETVGTVGTISIMAVTFYMPLRSAEKYLKNRAKKL